MVLDKHYTHGLTAVYSLCLDFIKTHYMPTHVNMYSLHAAMLIYMLCTCTNMFVRNGLCMHNWQFSYGKLKVYREDFKMVFDKLIASIYNHTLYTWTACYL